VLRRLRHGIVHKVKAWIQQVVVVLLLILILIRRGIGPDLDPKHVANGWFRRGRQVGPFACGRVDHHVIHQEQTIAVILHFHILVIFQEVKAAAGDSTRRPRRCEEIRQPVDGVDGDAVEGVEAEREEVGAEEAPSVDDGAPVLADAA